MQLQLIFYSMYGFTYQIMAAMAAGAQSIGDVNVDLFRVPELTPNHVLKQSGAEDAQQLFAHLPMITPAQLLHADAYIFAAPLRFGTLCAPMRHFLQQLQHLPKKDQFFGKISSVFMHTEVQPAVIYPHFHTLLDLGMVWVSMPHFLSSPKETLPWPLFNKRQPTADELSNAYRQGQHVANISLTLKHGKTLVQA